ncbi:MAG: NUDIX domain-containing protein [Nanoarchaeota archaeon]
MKKAVVAIINNEDEIVIGKKIKQGVLSENWHLPGETVEGNESYEEAIRRLGLEELGIKIEAKKLLSESQNNETIVRWYECSTYETGLKPGSDLADAKWVERDKVKYLCGSKAVELWPSEVREYLA